MGRDANTLLELEQLRVYYNLRHGIVKAVDGISFTMKEKETIGLVGESGCGKSTLGLALMKILPSTVTMMGRLHFDGEDIISKSEKEMQSIRGSKITMIFQDPMTSLNPVMKVKDHFIEMIRTHIPKISEEEAMSMAAKALTAVGISESRLNEYPFEFSGGMRQRVMIALGLVLNPKLVIADEPTTSLDVNVQAQIIELIKELKRKFNMSMLLITHDLGVVAELADRIIVMYAGHIMEISDAIELYESPKHPYTKALLHSIPNTIIEDMDLSYIPGSPPNLISPPKGCRFAPRCDKAMKICREKEPPLFDVNGAKVKCWLYGDKE